MENLLRRSTSLSLTLAMQALQAALDKAAEHQAHISIAIVDAGSQLIHMAHMDGAPLLSRDIALNKALTAASFKVSTSSWQTRLAPCSAAVQQGLPLQPNMALFGGGEPFVWQAQVIGAIGVSGASEQVDGLCALAAVEHLQTLLPDSVSGL